MTSRFRPIRTLLRFSSSLVLAAVLAACGGSEEAQTTAALEAQSDSQSNFDQAALLAAALSDPIRIQADESEALAAMSMPSQLAPSDGVKPAAEDGTDAPDDEGMKRILNTTTAFSTSDPRIVTLLNGDVSPRSHKDRDRLQMFTGQSIWRLPDMSTSERINHSDGSIWFGRAQGSDGKYRYTERIRQGQPLFQGNSQRAEWTAPSSGLQNLPFVINEKGSYWFAWDYRFGSDVVSNTGTQYGGPSSFTVSGAHAITWGDLPRSSGHELGLRVVGSKLYFRIHGPGSDPSYVYDVINTPLSNAVVGTVGSGGQWGTSRNWAIANLQADVSVKLIGRVKFANTRSGGPRTEVWRKIGTGPMVKIIDNYDPNTYSTGVRYWKVGPYTWDTSSTWWGNKNTRTMQIRSDLWIRNENASGYPTLTPELLMSWLDR